VCVVCVCDVCVVCGCVWGCVCVVCVCVVCVCVCVCSRIYPTCSAHASYFTVIFSLFRSTIFSPHYLINVSILEKKIIDHKMRVLVFSTNLP